jgi:hypothetical protein
MIVERFFVKSEFIEELYAPEAISQIQKATLSKAFRQIGIY